MNTLEFVTSKLGRVQPETRSIAEELYNVAKAAGHEIWFMWGMGSSSEHKTGLALDLMVRNEAAGDFVRDYIWANRARLRLRHVIWEQHITSTVVQPGVRRKMTDRGNVTENHYDHIHTWFYSGAYQAPSSAPSAAQPATPPSSRKSNTQVAAEVWAGTWGSGDDRKRRLTAAGYDADTIQALVNKGVGNPVPAPAPTTRTVAQLAAEVLNGRWGNGDDRKNRLKASGYDADAVQAEVNRQLSGRTATKSVSQLAREVIAGQWGNGPDRVRRLTRAGFNAKTVQAEVNRRV